jgi:acetyl esterase/lipase
MDLEPRTDQVHREILGFLPPNLMDFSDLEAGRAQLMAMLGAAPVELPDDVTVEDHHTTTADGHELLVRLYRPRRAGPRSAALYWMHGGGMILGNVSMDDALCASYATSVGIVVASVEYRLAPEFPDPTPIDDCYRGLAWLFDAAEALGVDPARIAIGGASAGAGLAAGLALMVRDRGDVRPCFQLLRYPMIDDRNETPSSHAITDLRVWNRSANLIAWSAYLDGRAGSSDVSVYAAPSRATDLSGLPPAIVMVGDLDMFLDEDIAYAQALLRAGVPTELHVYPGSFHGSDVMVPHADASQRCRRDELAALSRAFLVDPA